MDVRHADNNLDRLEFEVGFTAGFSKALVSSYRKKMQFIRGLRMMSGTSTRGNPSTTKSSKENEVISDRCA